jgi:hypothetical protein
MSTNARINRAFQARLRKFNINVAKATLTQAVNGTAQSVAIGVVTAGMIVLAVAFRLNQVFTGGGASAVTVTIGDTIGGVSRYGSAMDVFGGSVSTVYLKPTTPGAFAGPYAAGDTINAIFTPDGAHNLAALTQGSVDFDIVYTIPDAGLNN